MVVTGTLTMFLGPGNRTTFYNKRSHRGYRSGGRERERYVTNLPTPATRFACHTCRILFSSSRRVFRVHRVRNVVVPVWPPLIAALVSVPHTCGSRSYQSDERENQNKMSRVRAVKVTRCGVRSVVLPRYSGADRRQRRRPSGQVGEKSPPDVSCNGLGTGGAR